MEKNKIEELLIYQWENWEICLKNDTNNETIWANLNQIAKVFGRDKSVIAKHTKNIYKDWELTKNQVAAFFATTASDGKTYNVEYFNLDMVLSIWYRVNSKLATKFRQRATKTLKQHITQWFTINSQKIKNNYQSFLKAIDDVKTLINNNPEIKTDDVLELIKSFGQTWFSLDNFDKWEFPIPSNQQDVLLTSKELMIDLQKLKKDLIKKWEASELFAQEKKQWNLEGIVGSVFQSVFWQDAYPSVEEKSAHLLYFIIKNHPFNDGNKRSGAFGFIRFLQKIWYEFKSKITPQTLATLTILIAQSDPKEKEKMVWLILLLLIWKE